MVDVFEIYDETTLLHFVMDSVVPGICLDCKEETVTRCEPDAREGDYECPCCGGWRVVAVTEIIIRGGTAG